MMTEIHRPRARANKTRPVMNLILKLTLNDAMALSPVKNIRVLKIKDLKLNCKPQYRQWILKDTKVHP